MNKTKLLLISGVLVLSAINAFWMLSAMSLKSHECFVSVTAREMLESGNYVQPTCNGVPRLQKTPLSYWLVAGVAKLTGRVNEFSARLPSVVFAILSAVTILYFVNNWLGLQTAIISTAVWTTTLAYIRGSHGARPDMGLVFFVLLCLASFYSATIASRRRDQIIYMLIFWFSFALGNLAKGPAPVAYVFVPVLSYIALNRKWDFIKKMMPFAGIIIILAVVMPWPLFTAYKLNWNMTLWKKEFIDRFLGDYVPGNYPFYYYLPIMFKYVAPWFVFLPIALAAPFYSVWGKKQPIMKYLWLWFVSSIIFLTIDGGKRQHYILPAIPPMAILTGILLEDMIFIRKAYDIKFAKTILKIHLIAPTVLSLTGVIVIAFIKPLFLQKVIILSAITICISGFSRAVCAEKTWLGLHSHIFSHYHFRHGIF